MTFSRYALSAALVLLAATPDSSLAFTTTGRPRAAPRLVAPLTAGKSVHRGGPLLVSISAGDVPQQEEEDKRIRDQAVRSCGRGLLSMIDPTGIFFVLGILSDILFWLDLLHF